eukprot:jgi/Botrbrau1/7670/Bobra.0159s0112.1
MPRYCGPQGLPQRPGPLGWLLPSWLRARLPDQGHSLSTCQLVHLVIRSASAAGRRRASTVKGLMRAPIAATSSQNCPSMLPRKGKATREG